ncbi:uncharacterized protein N7515_001873 [Penicillium bovifimosum]|uniref:Reverse transcriptase domain-containing protein n=1 Tax=Penicillium bovifimosum TaxID=126998 RepID=A0A9W9L8T2_9EURO|nr:uncharacterized protein N7515_001873 [Penicillium bovifimosum]KAJ5143086.1 hypothetical protein N7515_001873 [Penicillium bovifimosum]
MANALLQPGTPQGSPLSPVLFILFAIVTSLYRRLSSISGLATIGFADDTNLLAFGKDTTTCCGILEHAYRVCDEWAKERGMRFGPEKSELIHFTRTRLLRTEGVRILEEGRATLAPVEPARFLGVWLDRKFSFKYHVKRVRVKLETQSRALTRLSSKTWGVRVSKSRDIYTKSIRSVMEYGASAWHSLLRHVDLTPPA